MIPPPSSPATVTHSITMQNGWTWVSFPVEFDDYTLNSVFSSANLGGYSHVNGNEVKDQYVFAEFYAGYGFYGTLTSVNTNGMFAVKMSSSATLTVTGPPVTLPKTININQGWTYVPVPYQTTVTLASGMAVPSGFSYGNGDEFKDFFTFSEFYQGYGWYGTLTSMVPGIGYMLKTASSGTATYNELAAGRRLAEGKKLIAAQPVEEMRAAGPAPADWTVDAGRYAQTMTMVALVTIDGVRKESGTLAAIVGKELRGVQATAKIPPFGAYAGKALYLLVIRGNEDGDSVSFQYYDGATKTALDKTVKFAVNGKVGNVVAPFMLAQKPKLFG